MTWSPRFPLRPTPSDPVQWVYAELEPSSASRAAEAETLTLLALTRMIRSRIIRHRSTLRSATPPEEPNSFSGYL
jgi:hypothetical protein